MDTLFYDAHCPLCRREVALLRYIARPTLGFQDIHTATGESLPSTLELLKSLHLRRESGAMVSGLDANVAAWQHTPFGLFWRVLLLPGIRMLAAKGYDYWALKRYSRLYSCSIGQSSH